MIVILILLLVVIAYAGYIYLRERPPAELPKPTVPASRDSEA